MKPLNWKPGELLVIPRPAAFFSNSDWNAEYDKFSLAMDSLEPYSVLVYLGVQRKSKDRPRRRFM